MNGLGKKDILVLFIAISVIGSSVFFLLKYLNPPTQKSTAKSPADNVVNINPNFDENTYKRIQSLKDYGVPSLENIGKKDLFFN